MAAAASIDGQNLSIPYSTRDSSIMKNDRSSSCPVSRWLEFLSGTCSYIARYSLHDPSTANRNVCISLPSSLLVLPLGTFS